mgnify:CR=1 FL=1
MNVRPTLTDWLIAFGFADKLAKVILPHGDDLDDEAEIVTSGQHFLAGSPRKNYYNTLPPFVVIEDVDAERYAGKLVVRCVACDGEGKDDDRRGADGTRLTCHVCGGDGGRPASILDIEAYRRWTESATVPVPVAQP